MESFEEISLPAGLAEALSAEGIERPTPLQADAIPLLRRGNNALVRAGPGGGTLVAYGVPLLERIESEGKAPRAVVVTASAPAAGALAESLARLALATGHGVAALGSTWASPERCDILFGTAPDLLDAVRSSRLRLEDLRALVVDGAANVQLSNSLEDLQTLIAFLPATAQRVVVSLPVTPEVESFARAHAKKAAYVPVARSTGKASGPVRGLVRYRVSRKTDGDIVRVASELLEEGARHVLVFCRSDDDVADVGDLLSLHGFLAGAPGDASAPVWLGSQEDSSGSSILEEMSDRSGVATLSVDVPAGAEALRHRHGLGATAAVLAAGRELAHLKQIAAEAGYRLQPLPKPDPARAASEPERRRNELLRILKEDDLTAEVLLLDPLFERYDPVEVAAAASRLAGRAVKSGGKASAGTSQSAAVRLPVRAQAWVRLFVSIGSRDGVGPGDLLGAAREAGIDRSQVGKIEIQDTYSRLEVKQEIAEKVQRAMNGTTLGGRSVRVDYHREPSRGPPGRSPPRRGGSGSGAPARRRIRPAS